MKLTNLLLLFLCSGLTTMAQEKARYTYVTDKVFHQGSELYGYTLVPNEWEDTSGSHGKLAPGEVAFSIFRGYLVVKGTKSEGSYNINRIEKEGSRMLKIIIMDSKDPSKQGSFKVILDDHKNIDAYIFRQSRNHDEVIYYQAGLSAEEKTKNEQVFTDKDELFFEEDTLIWGSIIYPFFVMNRSKCGRIYSSDNVSIKFVETIEIKEVPEQLLARQSRRGQKKAEKKKALQPTFADELDELEDDETDADFGFFQNDTQTASPEATEELEPEIVKEKKEKAPKEKITYSIVYTHNKAGFGARQQTAIVKKWQRLDSKGGGEAARYAIKFETNSGDVMVYLNDENAVSAVEIDENRYLMRGY